jgi:hypothetical protein
VKDRITDESGDPVDGVLVHVYRPGTEEHQRLWTDASRAEEMANPMVTDLDGRFECEPEMDTADILIEGHCIHPKKVLGFKGKP